MSINLMLSAGCSIDSKISRIGTDRLIADTETLESRTGHLRNRYRDIPHKYWPESYRELKPIQVKAFNRGIILIKHQSEKRESGVYVIIESPEIKPLSGSGEGFTKISDRIYWADIKIRTPIELKKPKKQPNQPSEIAEPASGQQEQR